MVHGRGFEDVVGETFVIVEQPTERAIVVVGSTMEDPGSGDTDALAY